jgi:hypothetical protein
VKRLIVLAVLMLGLVGVASAAVNPVTPSTNDINRANGWAHVDQLSQGPGTVDLQFISTRTFYSCFEYRTDGDTSQKISDTNYNTNITDGLYPFHCESNSSQTFTIHANAYVEVRMVFGAETDERFDWTRFDVGPKCQPTGFFRDGINLTAAQIGGTATGALDATGCNIGVYYGPGSAGTVSGADIFGADYYGVVANAAAVDVTNSSIHDIGESPFNGTQHGVGVFYTTLEQDGVTPTGAAATGTIGGNTITQYQKNGVNVNGPDAVVTVQDNTVTGLGMIDFIAQNGIQISRGATALVTGNTVSGNWYTPATVTACGLLYYQADGVRQSKNKIAGNQTPLCNAGRGGGQFNP